MSAAKGLRALTILCGIGTGVQLGLAYSMYNNQPDFASAWEIDAFRDLLLQSGILFLVAAIACIMFFLLQKLKL